MPVASRTCPTCDTPLPEGAKFCPACGARSPIEISRTSGEAHWPAASDADELEYRQRLQQALGDAYQLRELIGLGGFGVVYAAWDVKLEREVAVKALRHDLFPTRMLLERFQREARAVARLRHPHIIPMYAVGGGEGLAYMIMPRIEGESLSTVLAREQRLPIEEARRILLEASSALHAAHKRGVVHRDVKPENILLEGEERRVLLVDFGIAKAVTADETGLTGTGMAIGTPDYMSPEQASGARAVDHRTDQYALAVVGYRMLTGKLPFDAATLQEAFHKRALGAPPTAGALRPDVPAFLADALHRAMAESPDERYASMEEFAAAITGGAAPVTPRGAGRAEPAPELADPRAPAISRPVAALGLLGLLAFTLLYRIAFPPDLGAPAITRREALSIGRKFLVDRGAVPLKEAVRFESRSGEQGFLERTLGPDSARRWIEGEGDLIGGWSLRWFEPQQIEGWSVRISGEGTVDFFEHTIDDAAPGAHLDATSARAVADSFLLALGWKLVELEAQQSSSEPKAARTDHLFSWRKRGSEVTWNDADTAATPAYIRVVVHLRGKEIGRYERSLWMPPDVYRTVRMETAERIRGPLTAILMIGVPFLVLGILAVRGRAQAIRWAPALIVAGVRLAAVLVDGVNAWPVLRYGYWIADSLPGFFVDQLQQFVAEGVLEGAAMCLLAALGEYLARETVPRTVVGYLDAFRGRLLAPAVIRAGVAGCVLGLVIMGYNAVFWLLAKTMVGTSAYACPHQNCIMVSTLTPALDVPGHSYPDHFAPFLAGALDAVFWAMMMALASWFFITIAVRYIKSATATVLVVGALFSFLGPWVYPTGLGSLGSGIALVIFGVILLRYGVLTLMVAVYFSESASTAIAMLAPGGSGLVLDGMILLLCAFLPVAPLLVARRRGLPVPALVG